MPDFPHNRLSETNTADTDAASSPPHFHASPCRVLFFPPPISAWKTAVKPDGPPAVPLKVFPQCLYHIHPAIFPQAIPAWNTLRINILQALSLYPEQAGNPSGRIFFAARRLRNPSGYRIPSLPPACRIHCRQRCPARRPWRAVGIRSSASGTVSAASSSGQAGWNKNPDSNPAPAGAPASPLSAA